MRKFILLLISFSFSTFLASQETSDSLGIEEITISASRASETDPVTFQNIGLGEIEHIYNGQDAAVLLQQLSPSIVSYSDAGTDIGNYAQFRMRGISQSRINITLNGVPLNDMVDQGVYFSNFSDFGSSIESMQVQRGVAASAIGVASYGGAVNFESINLFGSKAGSNIQLTGGSFGTMRGSAEIQNLSKNGRLGTYGRFTKTKTDGYKDHSASDSYSIFGSAGYLVGGGILKFTGFMGKTQNGQSYLPVLISDIDASPKTNYNHPNDTDDFEQEMFSMQYSTPINYTTNFDATVYYGGARGEFPFSVGDAEKYEYGLTNDHYGFLTHISHEGDQITLKGGLQGYLFDRVNYDYQAPNRQLLFSEDHTDKNEFSLFGKIGYKMNQLNFYGDVQLRNIDMDITTTIPDTDPQVNQGWTFLNFVGGVHYQLSPNQGLYLSYGRSGREPTRSDIRNGVTEAEYANDLELGWRYQSPQLAIEANLFSMSFDNEITSVGALQERSYMEIRQNVPESYRRGVEAAISYRSSEALQVQINAAYLDANVAEFNNGTTELEDVTQVFSPKWTISPRVTYRPSKQFGLTASALHVSSSFMELSNQADYTMPAFTVINLQGEVNIHKNVALQLQANNIFNQRYYTDGAPVDNDYDGLPEGPGYRIQPPRHFYITLKIGL